MKVMYVDHTARLSGGELALARLLPALMKEITPVVVLAEAGPLVERLRSLGVRVEILPLSSATGQVRKEALRDPRVALSRVVSVVAYSLRLRRMIVDEGVQIVHTNSLKSGLYGCLAARLSRVPSVWHLRDRLASDYLPRFALLLTRAALTLLPSRVICNSAATLATLPAVLRRRRWGRPVVVHSPVDAIAEPVPPADRSEPGAPRAFSVGLVGRFAPWKGQLEAVQAFAREEMPADARLVLIGAPLFGEERYAEQVRQEARRLGLDDRVDFVGFVDDVMSRLAELDVLLHASLVPEPFGQVIVEGMAAGVSVVATRGGGPSEIIKDGVDGLLYTAGDTAELARTIRRLRQDGELRATLRENGLRRSRDFSTDVIAPEVLAVYDQLIRGARRAAA